VSGTRGFYVRWTDPDDSRLRQWRLIERKSFREIAELFGDGRSPEACRHRATKKLGLVHALWTPADDEKLKELRLSGKTLPEIAKLLGGNRSPGACQCRAHRLGIGVPKKAIEARPKRKYCIWTKEDEAIIRSMREERLGFDVIARKLGRNKDSIKYHAFNRMGLERFRAVSGRKPKAPPIVKAPPKFDIPPIPVKPPKQRPCIGALCTEDGAVRKMSRPGQWLCDRCVVYTRGVHAGGV
jgi:hypothetical protein